jgi:multidrug efflux pump subunit AcrA (membrane-fusion protein)
MTITTNIDKMTHTTRQMTELQRGSFETLAKNFAALQRRNVELTQKWLTGAYRPFFPFTYAIYAQDGLKAAQQGTEQALEATQQATQQALEATQQALEATQQVAQQGLRVAEEATAKAEKATVKAEEAAVKAEQATMEAKQATVKTQAETREAALRAEEETREVALQAAVHRSLKTKDYEELNVDEVSKKLDGLSATELKKVRDYEMHNKNRSTLITEIDGRLSATA